MKFLPPLPAQTNVSRALTTTELKEASSGYARVQAVELLATSLQKNLTPHQVAHQPSPHQHLLTALESRCTYYRLNTELPPKISKATISNISIIGSRNFKQRLKPLPKLIFQRIDKSLANIAEKSHDLLKAADNQPKDRLAAD